MNVFISFSVIMAYVRHHLHLFFGRSSPFSNFHHCCFLLDGTVYTSVEQFYQSQKAFNFHDEARAAQILEEDDPAVQKRIGRGVPMSIEDRGTWQGCCRRIIRRGALAKVCFLFWGQQGSL